MTIRESILAQIKTLLDGVAGASAYRSREAPATRAEGVVLVIRPEDEAVELRGAAPGLSVRDLTVSVTVISRGAIPDQVSDPAIEAVHAALMANQTLGNRCARIVEAGTKYDFEQADQTALAVELRFVVRYMTPASTLAVQA